MVYLLMVNVPVIITSSAGIVAGIELQPDPLLEESLPVFAGNPNDFFCLGIRQVTLLCKFHLWLQPYLTKMLSTPFTDVNMSSILIVIRIPEQELPDNLRGDIQQNFRCCRYSFIVYPAKIRSFCESSKLFVRKSQIIRLSQNKFESISAKIRIFGETGKKPPKSISCLEKN